MTPVSGLSAACAARQWSIRPISMTRTAAATQSRHRGRCCSFGKLLHNPPQDNWARLSQASSTRDHDCAIKLTDLLLDPDTTFTQSFQAIIASGQVEPLALPARSPNLNAYAERWVRSVKEECCATTKETATSCYFLGTGTSIVSGVSNAAGDWAGSCVIIIKKPHEKAVR
jgi:hypothetical protein